MKHQKTLNIIDRIENLNPRTVASLLFLSLSILIIAWRIPGYHTTSTQTTPESTPTAILSSSEEEETNLTVSPQVVSGTITPETTLEVIETPTILATAMPQLEGTHEDMNGLNSIIVGCLVLVLIIIGGTIFGIKAKQSK